jgi:hypothetical protein
MNFLNAQGIDMGFRHFRRIRVLAMSLATMVAILFGGARPASAQGTCPASGALKNFQIASNVAAFFSTNAQTHITTYTFVSLTNENPVGGVPGLIKYCVYPSPASQPSTFAPQATGANGNLWTVATGSSNFAFARPAGNPSNISLGGQITVMGTATWTTVPVDQTILLHINDAAVCASIYGSDSSGTCFVKPTNLAQVCNAGNTGVAYNAMPYGAVDCPKPSLGFEATQTNEFGDEVKLAGTARKLVSLSVLFASFACESGHWNTNDCTTTTPGAAFTHSITGNIYAVLDCSGTPCPGALLATVTQDFTIPYRPSKNAVKCTGALAPIGDAGKWFNPVSGVSGLCQNQISTVLTFNFPLPLMTLPDNVIWTVAFNTSTAGYTPIAPVNPPCGAGGCPYDSLNVGAQAFSGAPYAGTDVNADEAFGSVGPGGLLAGDVGWTPYKPLGAITTTP